MKSTDIRMTLVDKHEWRGTDGQRYRREEWMLRGGEVDPVWCRDADGRERAEDWEPSCCFTLVAIDGAVDRRLARYSGAAWPTAWPALFKGGRFGFAAVVAITDLGLQLRDAALREAPTADRTAP